MKKFTDLKDLPIKSRLGVLGKRQIDLLDPLRERGFTIEPARLSLAVNGRIRTPQGLDILVASKASLMNGRPSYNAEGKRFLS